MEQVDNKNPEQIQSYVEKIRAIVEVALRTSFGTYNASTLRQFRGRLSTDQHNVDSNLTTRSFYGNCGTFNLELKKALREEKLHTDYCESDHEDSNHHEYLIADENGIEVIIDPTIGQFIKGHNNTFIGTRAQLKDLVLNQTGEGKLYKIVNTKSANNPTEAFERTWGNEPSKIGVDNT